jgi:hypothetical protein
MTCFPLIVVALAALSLDSDSGETVVRLSFQPMPAPKPALKYQLLPELRELNPGNPAHEYLRCFAEQQNFFFSKEAIAERARYLSMPLEELPAEKLRDYGRFALQRADWAARLDSLDWQLLRHVQTDEMEMSLPQLGRLQVLASALRVRFRAEVAGRRFDDAVRTAKTMFALARHLGEYPAEAANLVGLLVAHLGLDTLEEMMQQPGCPNLYWALTDLPCPLVEVRKGIQGDRTLAAVDLRLLRDDTPMTEDQLEQFVSRLSGKLGLARAQAGQPPRNLRAGLAARVKDARMVRTAGDRLVETGFSDDLVRRFPPLQIILLDDRREYEVRRDEGMKLLALAPWQIDALAGTEELACCGDGVFAELLPRVISARRAQGRLEQRIALLRHIEALRLYAATNDGKLPANLADLSVPLPPDPFTGKPFIYKIEAGTAHLDGSPPRGEEQNPCFNIRYEVKFSGGSQNRGSANRR